MTDDDQVRAALAANPFPSNPWVYVSEDGIIIKAGYSDTLHRMLRWVPKAQWIPERRYWKVPLAGAELIRSVLPEITRLAEATYEDVTAHESPPQQASEATPQLFGTAASGRDLFRNAARFLFGTDWQRDTARALGRDEPALACWLVGEEVLEDDEQVLLEEMLELMRRRAAAITAAADQLADVMARKRP